MVILTSEPCTNPRRSARTVNDNGPGAESAASNAVSVGKPKAPAVQVTGSSTAVKIAFTPDMPETGDTWMYWAEDASLGSISDARLYETIVAEGERQAGQAGLVGNISCCGCTYWRRHTTGTSQLLDCVHPHPSCNCPRTLPCRWPARVHGAAGGL